MTKQDTSAQPAHSSIVGGSSAERVINCPGSVQKLALLPPEIKNKSSVYADEGTALHAAVQYVLENDIVDLDDIIGMEFGGDEEGDREPFEMTPDLVDNAVAPCIDFFDWLDDMASHEGGMEFMTEARCEMPGIPGAFGTSDIVARTDKRSVIVDWKFGAGVAVKAFREGENNVKIGNAQLMFYARAAMFSFPDMFGEGDDWPVDFYIVQPRLRDGDGEIYSRHTTTRGELETFRMTLVKAVAEAEGKDPKLERGDWCRFAACKVVCPHHTGPAIDLTKMHQALMVTGKKASAEINWSEAYGDLLDLADLAEMLTREIRAQAHVFMNDGHVVRGRKLVDKRATERYVDPDGALRHVVGLGIDEADAKTEPELKTPAQLAPLMEPLMEGKTKKARTEAARHQIAEFTQAVSSGTTIAHEDDKRADVIPTATQLKSLAEKLAAISGQ